MKPLDILIAIAVPVTWGFESVFANPAVDQFPRCWAGRCRWARP